MPIDPDSISEVTVALQGTLDTFALADVLRLLASTRKTGRFHITGSRGSGSVYVDGGSVVAAETSNGKPTTPMVEVVFELLRFNEGSFIFEPDRAASEPGAPVDVDPLLAAAEGKLAEWRQIEAVVPSLESWVTLAPALKAEVVIDPDRWRTVAAVGSGATVWSLGDALALGEIDISRAVKDLVEVGLATVGSSEPAHAEPVLVETTGAEGFGITLPSDPPPAPVVVAADPLPAVVFADAPPDEAEEVARQLASLSPRAARAVAAAANAETDEEREAALAEVPDDEEPINRGLLLKFLSSVRS